jgi:hypothetical protein
MEFKEGNLVTIVNALSNIQFRDVGNPETLHNIAMVSETIKIATGKLEELKLKPATEVSDPAAEEPHE